MYLNKATVLCPMHPFLQYLWYITRNRISLILLLLFCPDWGKVVALKTLSSTGCAVILPEAFILPYHPFWNITCTSPIQKGCAWSDILQKHRQASHGNVFTWGMSITPKGPVSWQGEGPGPVPHLPLRLLPCWSLSCTALGGELLCWTEVCLAGEFDLLFSSLFRYTAFREKMLLPSSLLGGQ